MFGRVLRGLFHVALARVIWALRWAPAERRGLAIPYLWSLRAVAMPGARLEIAEFLVQHLIHLGVKFDDLVVWLSTSILLNKMIMAQRLP